MVTKAISIIFIFLIVSARAADVSIDSTVSSRTARGVRSLVFTSSTVGYVFYIDSNATFGYKKTTDAGATWGTVVQIATATTHVSFDVWYDKWTPGNSGTLIHTWYFDTTNNNVFWRTLDTSSDTLGTQRTAFTGVSAVTGRGAFCSGTETRSGYLYVAFDLDAGAEKGLVRSTDSGTTWSANLDSNFVEATIDQCLLFPATGTGDDNDCWAIYQDASADELTMKMWDSSAAGQIESSSMQSMIENINDGPGQGGFSGSVRLSDGHLIVVSVSKYDDATSDMQVWDVNAVNSGSLTGITAKTDITTDIDDNYYPSVYIDVNNALWVAYNGKRDGSEELGSVVGTKVYYTKSTDGGSTWSSGDTTYMQGSLALILQVWTPLSGSCFYAVWRNSNLNSLEGNAANMVCPTPAPTPTATATSTPTPTPAGNAWLMFFPHP